MQIKDNGQSYGVFCYHLKSLFKLLNRMIACGKKSSLIVKKK